MATCERQGSQKSHAHLTTSLSPQLCVRAKVGRHCCIHTDKALHAKWCGLDVNWQYGSYLPA